MCSETQRPICRPPTSTYTRILRPMKAPNRNVASELMPLSAPPKTPLPQLPMLPVSVFFAESTRFASMFSLCSVSLIQFTAAWTSAWIVDHCLMTPTVISASKPKAPATMATVTINAPQALPT